MFLCGEILFLCGNVGLETTVDLWGNSDGFCGESIMEFVGKV